MAASGPGGDIAGLQNIQVQAQVDQIEVHGTSLDEHHLCRSRLAGEEAFGFCIGLERAFAGKPAPTAVAGNRFWHVPLAGQEAGSVYGRFSARRCGCRIGP
ncbi:hypothetical protein CW358_00145 [Pseudomonas protegens]|nr:hypothetical protein CW358_00145 [Pseudomonas protegens]